MITLDDYAHLRQFSSVRFKEEVVGQERFTIVTYMIADEVLWDQRYGREVRGHVFNQDGVLVSVALEKIFNYQENKYTQKAVLDHKKVTGVFDKRDGSLITPVLLSNNHVIWKTKKTFFSDVANEVNARAFTKEKELSKFLLQAKLTPIFEYTSRSSRIVLDYGSTPLLTLLAVRDNQTLEYVDRNEVQRLASRFDVPLIDEIPLTGLTVDQIYQSLQPLEQIEGYVVWVEDDIRLKMKTPWYLHLHRLNTEIRERDIASMVIDETIDDVKSLAAEMDYDMEPLHAIEQRVVNEINGIIRDTTALAEQFKQCKDKKEIAERFKHEPLFGLAVRLYENREVDFKEYWKRNYLNQYSLDCVYNTAF